MQQGPAPEVDGDSRFPPYYCIDTSGATLEIPVSAVHRDYGEAFPLKAKTWRRIQREGNSAFFNSDVIRQGRKLVPRCIVVVASGRESNCYDGQLEYQWFIRCSATTGGDTDAPFYGNSFGYHFLWPLASDVAVAYCTQLAENDGMATSRLVTDFRPEEGEHATRVHQFEGVNFVKTLERWIDRVFVGSVSPWGTKRVVPGSALFDSARVRRSTQKRSDCRKPLFNMLPPEVVSEILVHAIGDGLYGAGTEAGTRMLGYRRVCRTFHEVTRSLMAEWTRSQLPLLEHVKAMPELKHCYAMRDGLVLAGRSVLDALAEWSRLSTRPIEWDERGQSDIYLRLRFSKPFDSRPPPPPPKPSKPPTEISMYRVHGKRELEGTGVYATRKAKEQCVVKMRMRVPVQFRSYLCRSGWDVLAVSDG